MIFKYKTFKYKVEPKLGTPPIKKDIEFDREESRKSIIRMLGIDDSLSDEELKEYKTAFAPTFANILDEEIENEVSALDYVNSELDAKESALKETNKNWEEDYLEELDKWENGYEAHKTIQMNLDKSKWDDEIKKIEELPQFLEWVDEYEINEIKPLDKISKDVVQEYLYYKVGDIYLICPKHDKYPNSQVSVLAEENGLDWKQVEEEEVDYESSMTIFQFYSYVDANRPNRADSIIKQIVDEEETVAQNKRLVPDNPDLLTSTGITENVEEFEEFALGVLGDIANGKQ